MTGSIRFCDSCGATNRMQGKFCTRCGQALLNPADPSQTGVLSASHVLKQRYRVRKKLGAGGFGAVYQVEDLSFASALRAAKEMQTYHIDAQEAQQAIASFRQEAMLLAGLMHPNLPRIYDHFEERGRWYLVMDYVEGETLEELLERTPGKKFTVQQVLPWAIQLCAVLGYLHNRQPPIIFRDLKPANIMITSEDHLYLIDFGIARLFKSGQARDTVALGSPGYAAPEQYGKAQTTELADIYGLGATLHHLLSGRDPSEDPFQFPPLDLKYASSIGPALADLIMKMVETPREKRPASMQVIKQELQHLAQQPWQAMDSVSSQASPPQSANKPPQQQAPSPAKGTTSTSHTSSGNSSETVTNKAEAKREALFTFRGHPNAVHALTWLPDSIHITSGGSSAYKRGSQQFYDGSSFQYWNARTGQVLFSSSKYIMYLTSSSQQSRLAFGSFTSWGIRAFPTGDLLYSAKTLGDITLDMRNNCLHALAWSPDEKCIAFGMENGTIIFWDVTSQKIFARIKAHQESVKSLAWSPDSKYLASGSRDKKMHILKISIPNNNPSMIENVFTYSGYASHILAVAWSPKGNRIALGGTNSHIHICDALSGENVSYHKTHASTVEALVWSPDSQYIASGSSDHTVQVLEATTARTIAIYKGHTDKVNAVVWSPNGKYIASGSEDHTVRVWEAP